MCGLGVDFSSISLKVIGPRIGSGPSSSMRDGDGDGKCQEEGGKWIPCPPGVADGSVLRQTADGPVFDVPRGGGIDTIKDLPPAFRSRMAERMKKLGLSRRGLRNETRKAFNEASPELIEQARNWYPNVNKKTRELVAAINERHGSNISFEQGAAIIAALSPAREFGKNVRDAKKLMLVHAENKEFDITPEAIGQLRGEAKNKIDALLERLEGNKPKPSDFNKDELALLVGLHPTLSSLGNTTGLTNVIRAYSMFRGVEVNDALSGPKMRSFYSNIVNPDGDRATIDTWMYRSMVSAKQLFTIKRLKGDPLVGNLSELEEAGKRTQDIFQSVPGKVDDIPANVGLYPEFVDALRDVAREKNLTPAALQAIIWEIARTRAGYKPTKWDQIEKEFSL